MELRHLRYFQAVAAELNITRAAEKLYIAQPPLSRQIRQLETELGTALFERHTQGLRLTEAGRYFSRHVDAILDQVETAIAGTQAFSTAGSNTLRIGFVPSFLYEELPVLIQRLRARHDITLTLTELTTVEQIPALKSKRIDIGFGRLRITDSAIRQHLLFEEPLIAVLPDTHPWAHRPLTLAELAAEPLIIYPDKPRPSYADTVLAQFAQRGLSVDIIHQTNGLQTAIGMVASGLGFTLVPERVGHMHREGIAFCALREDGITSPVLASLRHDTTSAVVVELLDILQDRMGSHGPAGQQIQTR